MVKCLNMRNLEATVYTIGDNEPEGIEAEKGMADFLRENFSCIAQITQERSEQDDRNGIDMVADIECEDGKTYKLALEVSGPDEERMREKVKRQWKMPVVCLHDSKGKAISEPIPRVLIGYNVGYVLSRQKEAEKNGVSLSEEMSEYEKKELKGTILVELLNQINILSTDINFFQKIKPIRKAFQEERDELEEMGI